jgi:hypothetical protein
LSRHGYEDSPVGIATGIANRIANRIAIGDRAG